MVVAEKIGTQSNWRTYRASDTGRIITVTRGNQGGTDRHKDKEDAILTYLQAIRRLGHKRVTSSDVAAALDLPEKVVRRVMKDMADKGVKAL